MEDQSDLGPGKMLPDQKASLRETPPLAETSGREGKKLTIMNRDHALMSP